MLEFLYGISIWIVGNDLEDTFQSLLQSKLIVGNNVKKLMINNEYVSTRELTKNTVSALEIGAYNSVDVSFPNFQILSYEKSWGVNCRTSENFKISLESLVSTVKKIPFSQLSVPSSPVDDNAWDEYVAPELIGLPLEPLGFLMGFKNTGHDRLISRRWLDFGPWWTIKGKDDCSIVIFHDPEADPTTALEQAKPGHQRMGITDEGGFIEKYYDPKFHPPGFYIPAEKKLKVIIHGRKVSQREMLDAACFKYHHKNVVDNSEMKALAASVGGTLMDQSDKIDRSKPVDQVAYIFMEEKVAREHLHELWLRELECWAIINGVETRLDLDYNPTPEKPEWVKECEAKYPELSQK